MQLWWDGLLEMRPIPPIALETLCNRVGNRATLRWRQNVAAGSGAGSKCPKVEGVQKQSSDFFHISFPTVLGVLLRECLQYLLV